MRALPLPALAFASLLAACAVDPADRDTTGSGGEVGLGGAGGGAGGGPAGGAGGAAPGNGPVGLHVVGDHLEDGGGQRIVLRGVNRSGSEYACIQNRGFFDGPADE